MYPKERRRFGTLNNRHVVQRVVRVALLTPVNCVCGDIHDVETILLVFALFSTLQSSTDLACFLRFDKVSVYTTTNYKQKFRAPTDFCFVLKVISTNVMSRALKREKALQHSSVPPQHCHRCLTSCLCLNKVVLSTGGTPAVMLTRHIPHRVVDADLRLLVAFNHMTQFNLKPKAFLNTTEETATRNSPTVVFVLLWLHQT